MNLLTGWRDNPILLNELRGRMRGKRAFAVLAAHLIILSALISVIYFIIYQETVYFRNYYSNNTFQNMLQAASTLGQSVFYGSSMLLLFIVSLVGPAFTAGAIVNEKERQTYDLLSITSLSAREIVAGKLNAVIVFMGLLIFATLPFQSMAFFFGGVGFGEIFIAILILLCTTLLFCTLGLFVSSFARSTTIANMINYALIIPMLLGIPFLFFLFSIFSSSYFLGSTFNDPSLPVVILFTYGSLFLLSINPLSMSITSLLFLEETGSYFFSIESIGDFDIPLIAPWLIYVVFCLLMSLIFTRAAVKRVEKVSKV